MEPVFVGFSLVALFVCGAFFCVLDMVWRVEKEVEDLRSDVEFLNGKVNVDLARYIYGNANLGIVGDDKDAA